MTASPSPYYADESVTLWHGDALDVLAGLEADVADTVVTSPPYWGLRDYGYAGQWGGEDTVEEYVEHLVTLFVQLRRVLKPTGVTWLNLGDTYAGKANANTTSARGFDRDRPARQVAQKNRLGAAPYKSLVGVPWRVALALQQDGWAVRNAVVWHKPNPMPSPVTDRLVTAYEHCFLLAPAPRYYFDIDPVRQPSTEANRQHQERYGDRYERGCSAPGTRHGTGHSTLRTAAPAAGRNPGDVWTIATQPFEAAHFAVMPLELARRMVVTSCPEGGTVLDPFSGSGTTGLAATSTGRRYVGIDANSDYLALSLRTRLSQGVLVEDRR